MSPGGGWCVRVSETCGASRSPAKPDLGFLWEPAVCPTFPHPIPTPRAEPWSPTNLSHPGPIRSVRPGAIRARQGWRRGDWRGANPAPRLLLLFSVPAAGPGAPIALKKAAAGRGWGHPGEDLRSQRPQPASWWGREACWGREGRRHGFSLPGFIKDLYKGPPASLHLLCANGMVTSRGRVHYLDYCSRHHGPP